MNARSGSNEGAQRAQFMIVRHVARDAEQQHRQQRAQRPQARQRAPRKTGPREGTREWHEEEDFAKERVDDNAFSLVGQAWTTISRGAKSVLWKSPIS